MEPTGIEYVVVGCYLLALVGVGMVFRTFNENVSDYFRNGCKGTWWLVVLLYSFIGGSWAVTVCVTLIPSALGFFSETLFGETWSFQQKVFVNMGVGVVVYLLTMPFWKYETKAYQKQTDSFFERMLTPVDFKKEVGKPNDLRQLKVIGSFAAVMGALICLIVSVWLGRRDDVDDVQVQAAD